ncbi:hypothetical protein [Paraburkholderia silvatlantica]|uniref:DODA-type extradiol aromatic ring-opening family dioxygenase n=1 Tax=Paraburkholderia silvatlantica TaxID=321895 RepID=UPI0037512D97
MARITTVIAASHSPFLFQPLEWWNDTQRARLPSGNGKIDSVEDNAAKRHRIDAAFDKLRDVFQAARPDVMVIFGDDQTEQFDLLNFPSFAVYVGGTYSGYRTVGYHSSPDNRGHRISKPKTPEHWTDVLTRPDFAKAILHGMMREGFDPAFMMGLPHEEDGMGHAFMRPTSRITDSRFDIPVVPVLVNCFYAPQPSAARCVAAARAIRKTIAAWPESINVAVVGSGGLWHTPGSPDAYIDEAFDRRILEGVTSGAVDELAEYFDSWRPAAGLQHLRCYDAFDGGTGMPGGIGSGTGETRNWLMAAAVADRPGIVVDYVPVHASPCGMGFAYWNM